MKHFIKIQFAVLMLLNLVTAHAQEVLEADLREKNYFQISPRLGYDFPTYNNNTPYIDYNGGLDLGVSVDYYWDWFGIGLDFDYIKNKPESTYPTTNLLGLTGLFNAFQLSEKKITRMFYGIGPDFQYRNKTGKFSAELNTRAGLASINGGRTLLEGSTTGAAPFQTLNFHAGYDDTSVFSLKGQVRFNYWFNDFIAVNAGAYYLRHFGVEERNETGVSAAFQPFDSDLDQHFIGQNALEIREEPCDCDIWSIGVFAGVNFKLGKKKKQQEVVNVCSVCGLDHTPHCCATCGCSVTITAKDKYSNEVLPFTDVVLTDLNGNIVHSGTTNSYGVVVFKEVFDDAYLIKGKLYNVALQESTITKEDFKYCKQNTSGIQKDILYTDENFVLRGNVVECNTTNGIQGVDVVLKDKLAASQKNTLSDFNGDFKFHLKQASTYLLNGKKDGYFSNEVEYNTTSNNRNTSLFIDFEMCVDPCGIAIKLDNINFDLDKAIILPQSKPDLDYIVKLMQENPSITVEMSSHTDSQGSDSYNMDLSQRRANATVDYIVSKGISRSRLIARGAGETELKNVKCANGVPCTDDEHRINRRTEFKVVCF